MAIEPFTELPEKAASSAAFESIRVVGHYNRRGGRKGQQML